MKCTKCGLDKPESEFWMRHDRGVRYRACRSCMHAKHQEWARRNPDRVLGLRRAWEKRDPEHTRSVWRDMKRRRRQDPFKRMIDEIKTATSVALRGARKSKATFVLLGYSIDELKSHIERQFTNGMSWENYGQWHLDHIVPLSAFNITGTDCQDFRAAWALTNLRPIWATENVRKQAKRVYLL